MCTNKRLIKNPYTGKDLYVDCGKCPACQQAKADKRTARIRLHQASQLDKICLFVTLTYSNEFIPYIRKSELKLLGEDSPFVSIYRDKIVKYLRVSGSYDVAPCVLPGGELEQKYVDLSSLIVPQHNLYNCEDTDKIGVIYYKDYQDFYKRLNINLKRHYGINEKFSFFVVGEYGSRHFRPHFHFLLWCKPEQSQAIRHCIAESWKFCDSNRMQASVEIAKNAASYVSSYVSKSADLPLLFCDGAFKQVHHYSQNFGVLHEQFSPSAILEKVHRGSLTYDYQTISDGKEVIRTSVLPSYVINRYFPKFRGYSDVNNYDLVSIFGCSSKSTPEQSSFRINPMAEKMSFASDFLEYNQIKKRLVNAYYRFRDGMAYNGSFIDYLLLYRRVYAVLASSMLLLFYQSVNESRTIREHLEHYDNSSVFVSKYVENNNSSYACSPCRSISLLNYIGSQRFEFVKNINQFNIHLNKSSSLLQKFIKQRTKKAVNHMCYYKSFGI